jgi:DNA-binding CsgD family transcriptional regulator
MTRRLGTKSATSISVFRRLGLTHREADVLLWIARGQSNAEIGISLRISPRTVKKHLEHVFSKLGVRTRLAAAVRAGAACSQKSPGISKASVDGSCNITSSARIHDAHRFTCGEYDP